MELGEALARAGLDTLRLRRTHDGYQLSLSREHDPDLDWTRFNRAFDSDSVPCAAPVHHFDADGRERLARLDAHAALQTLEARLAEGDHQLFSLHVEPRLGLRFALFIHSSTLGRRNGLHALRAGGIRRHDVETPESEVYADGCQLARGMTYKNAAAALPMGGCKFTLQATALPTDDLRRLGFLAYVIESNRVLTGPDMGFSPAHVDALRRHFTQHCTGGTEGPLGPTGAPTALGVFFAIRAALAHRFGSPALTDRTVAVQGLGGVGRALADLIGGAGGRLVVADLQEDAVRSLLEAHPRARAVPTDEILITECDVLAPCARGGLLDEDGIDGLRAAIVLGGANNLLAASSTGDELRLARRVARRGILFQVDWLHNTAGVMSGFEEYLHGARATHATLEPKLLTVCGDATARRLSAADLRGVTPSELAYAAIDARLTAPAGCRDDEAHAPRATNSS